MREKAAAVATLDPEDEAKSAEAMTVAEARPPGMRPISIRALENRPRVSPACAAI
ncbi:hypothetical protein D9M69_731610 [compost metagenome]